MSKQSARKGALTLLIPTRNRAHNLDGQLRLFERSEFPVVVADSSDAEHADQIRLACQGKAEFWSFPSTLKFYDKLADAIALIETPYVLIAADRKITFPHAVEAALAYLEQHEDYVVAQGYVVGFAVHHSDIDINRVVFFTPSVDEENPLERHYHLMRRYQSWQFAVFRRAPLATAVAQAKSATGPTFQEVMFMNAIALQGKLARLPHILSLQTTEESFNALQQIDPFYWFLNDSRSFFRHYLRYRNALAQFISGRGIPLAPGTDLNQLLDTIHAVWLRHNFDHGVLNHAAQLLLGLPLPPLPHPRPPRPWRRVRWRDVAHPGQGTRRYVWRHDVLNAEPRNEIRIGAEEIQQVEQQLDLYFGDQAAQGLSLAPSSGRSTQNLASRLRAYLEMKFRGVIP